MAARRRRKDWRGLRFVLLGGMFAVGAACSSDASTAELPPSSSDSTSETDPDTSEGSSDIEVADERASGQRTADPSDDTPADVTAASTPANQTELARRCNPTAELDVPTNLTVWHTIADTIARDYLDEAVSTYEADHPNVSIEVIAQAFGPEDLIKEFSSIPPGQRPDVVLGTNMTVRNQAESRLFVPVAECADVDASDNFTDLVPVIERTYTVDGVLHAAPFNVSTPVLFYDRLVWDAAGVDSDAPPVTFDEMVATARALAGSGEVVTGVALSDHTASWLISQTAAKVNQVLVEPANGHDGALPDSVDEINLDDPRYVDVVQAFGDLSADGLVWWKPFAEPDENLLFKLATPPMSGMTLFTSAALGEAEQLIADAGIQAEIGVGPMPGPAPGGLAGGGAFWLTDAGDPDRVGTAWDFVEWMTAPAQVAELAARTGYVPTSPAAAAEPVIVERWATSPEFRVGYDQLTATPDTDAGAGMQLDVMPPIYRMLELAAAYTIDPEALSSADYELTVAEESALERFDDFPGNDG